MISFHNVFKMDFKGTSADPEPFAGTHTIQEEHVTQEPSWFNNLFERIMQLL